MGGRAAATWVAGLAGMAAAATVQAAPAGSLAVDPSHVMAPIHRMASDPPRIPLTRSVPVDLPSQTPEELARGLFARKTPFLGKVSGYRKAFMPDLARAVALDATPGDARIVEFDWRYGAPRSSARHLKLTTAVDGGAATVTARFRVGKEPREVLFQMFQRRTGWRIHDVGRPGPDGWSLRACLHMHGARIAPACKAPPEDPDSMKAEPVPPRTGPPRAVTPKTVPPGAVASRPGPPPVRP